MFEDNALEALYLAGLGGVCIGTGFEFGWQWAAIIGGAVILVTVSAALLMSRGKDPRG